MRKQSWIIVILILSLTTFFPGEAISQGKKSKMVTIGFYNLENLFDTIDDLGTEDQEFTPSGSGRWSSSRYGEKLLNLAEAIYQVGREQVSEAPAIMGLAEVENRLVIEDLVSTPPLKGIGYRIIHYDSPDKRGIDVALIYNPSIYNITGSKAVPFKIHDKPDFFTRDILLVSGTLHGQPLVILVNHWPSRSKGEKESAPFRNAASDLCRSLYDSIQKEQPGTGVIIMGDFNDDPFNESLVDHLKTVVVADSLKSGDLFNPMWAIHNQGGGTLAYKGKWNLFDQIIVSQSLMEKGKKKYAFYRADIIKTSMLLEQEGQYAGYPFRSYAGNKYLGGFSDHLPACIYLGWNLK